MSLSLSLSNSVLRTSIVWPYSVLGVCLPVHTQAYPLLLFFVTHILMHSFLFPQNTHTHIHTHTHTHTHTYTHTHTHTYHTHSRVCVRAIVLSCWLVDTVIGKGGGKTVQQYICAQAPLPNTFADFWRMVWEQSTYCFVRVCIFLCGIGSRVPLVSLVSLASLLYIYISLSLYLYLFLMIVFLLSLCVCVCMCVCVCVCV
jgi:Protein-tyrosine phosphatase